MTKEAQKIRVSRLHTRSRASRIVGWSLLGLSLITLVVNWIEEFTDAVTILPGGHSPFYLAGSMCVIVVGAWRAGIFDAK
ncbi:MULTISPECIES: hypothetical protein [Streptomyces]|uniref:Integral membrane protein n=2 Tax=Streptomyces rhizosphaericus TaxID=114699 RepID=A0ABN1QGV4_9ACTN|nr:MULTISPECIES: hypothetical protein [Streptomyces]EXU62734.1 hypothetical protein Z951_39835 [Streptomyces sp. PRh5]